MISKNLTTTSMMNNLKGFIKKIEIIENDVWVSIDSPIELKSRITENSLKKLELFVGDKIYLSFKSTICEGLLGKLVILNLDIECSVLDIGY